MTKKLYCSPEKKLCGVCAGFADYINVDPTIVRAVVTIVAICTAVIPALIIYFIAALIIPKAPDNYYQLYNNTSKRLTKGHNKKIAGVCSGIAEYFNCDETIVRIIFVLIVLWFGSGIFAYIACAILFPNPVDDYNYYQNPNGQYYGYNPNYNGQYQQPNNNQNYNAQHYQQDTNYNADNNGSNPESN